MAYKGYNLEFSLLKNGRPYGVSSDPTERWTLGTNVQVYEYGITIAGGIVTVGTVAQDINGTSPPASLVNDTNGQAYIENLASGRYTLVLNYQGGNNWMYFPKARDITLGVPAFVSEEIVGAGNNYVDLTALAPDGVTTRAPIYDDEGRRLWLTYKNTQEMTEGVHYTFSGMRVTFTNIPRRNGGTILAADEYVTARYMIWPGGGY